MNQNMELDNALMGHLHGNKVTATIGTENDLTADYIVSLGIYTAADGFAWLEQKTVTIQGGSRAETSVTFEALDMSTYTSDPTAYFRFEIGNAGTALADGRYRWRKMQVEVGDVSTPFEHRHIAEELELCQRYYVKSDSVDYMYFNAYSAHSSTLCTAPIRFPVEMRINPTCAAQTSYATSVGLQDHSPKGFNVVGTANSGTFAARVTEYTADAEL